MFYLNSYHVSICHYTTEKSLIVHVVMMAVQETQKYYKEMQNIHNKNIKTR
jgi:hypothetical protein